MNQLGLQKHDVVILTETVEDHGSTYPAGTEGVVVSETETGLFFVEVLEPRRELICVCEASLDPVEP